MGKQPGTTCPFLILPLGCVEVQRNEISGMVSALLALPPPTWRQYCFLNSWRKQGDKRRNNRHAGTDNSSLLSGMEV